MIEHIVRYLHDARVPFRLASYPSEEREPQVAFPLPPGSMRVDTAIVMIDGRAVLTCFPLGESLDLAAVSTALGGAALPGTTEDLPEDLRYAETPIPPLGQLFGLPLVVDQRVQEAAVLVFRAFGDSDFFEIPYEDFAVLEQPRIASFASFGELAAASAHA